MLSPTVAPSAAGGDDRIEVEQALVSEETGREHEALAANDQS